MKRHGKKSFPGINHQKEELLSELFAIAAQLDAETLQNVGAILSYQGNLHSTSRFAGQDDKKTTRFSKTLLTKIQVRIAPRKSRQCPSSASLDEMIEYALREL